MEGTPIMDKNQPELLHRTNTRGGIVTVMLYDGMSKVLMGAVQFLANDALMVHVPTFVEDGDCYLTPHGISADWGTAIDIIRALDMD